MSYGTSTTIIYYIDESFDSNKYCLVGLGLKGSTWLEAFELVKDFRTRLKLSDEIYLRKEIHARELVSGRGKLGNRSIMKWRRTRIFAEMLQLVASLPDVHMFNICLDVRGRSDPQMDTWDRLLNRINRTCEESARIENARRRNYLSKIQGVISGTDYDDIERRLIPYSCNALLIADKCRDQEIMRLRRKVGVFNHVPSQYGTWSTGPTKNIPLRHLIEDALFQDSAHSYLIQLADCAAFALLKRETVATDNVKKYKLDAMWDAYLASISVRAASRSDSNGIVRR
jgi:hypothetical protein